MSTINLTLNPVDGDRLTTLAAQVGKVGKLAVKSLIKQERLKARAEEREARSRGGTKGATKERSDQRQPLEIKGGERPAQLRMIAARLRDPNAVRSGSVLERGQTQVVLRFATEPQKLGERQPP